MPTLGTQSSPLGDVSLQLAILVFFAVDGHLLFLRALAASYAFASPDVTAGGGAGSCACKGGSNSAADPARMAVAVTMEK